MVDVTYKIVAENIEKTEFKKAAEAAMDLVAFANKYYDEQKPWVQTFLSHLCQRLVQKLENF